MSRPFAHAFVTGAGNGIGRCFAHQLAQRGTAVSVIDIDLQAARRVAAEVSVRGAKATVIELDVGDAEAMAAAAERAEAEFGPVDLLINNAGVLTAGAALSTPPADVRRAFDVNVWGVIHGSSLFGAKMAQRRHGHILTVASLAGVMPLPQLAAYCATKAAVIAYSETLCAELEPQGVGLTLLLPSFVATGFVQRAAASAQIRSLGTRLLQIAGQTPDEVARRGLAAAAARQHVCVPSRSGAVAWRLKRRSPELFARLSRTVGTLVSSAP